MQVVRINLAVAGQFRRIHLHNRDITVSVQINKVLGRHVFSFVDLQTNFNQENSLAYFVLFLLFGGMPISQYPITETSF